MQKKAFQSPAASQRRGSWLTYSELFQKVSSMSQFVHKLMKAEQVAKMGVVSMLPWPENMMIKTMRDVTSRKPESRQIGRGSKPIRVAKIKAGKAPIGRVVGKEHANPRTGGIVPSRSGRKQQVERLIQHFTLQIRHRPTPTHASQISQIHFICQRDSHCLRD